MNRWSVLYSYDEILLNNKKEWTTGMSKSMDESQNNQALWNKPDKNSIYRMIPLWFHLYKVLEDVNYL